MKASTSKVKVVVDDESTNDDSFQEEEMSLFVKHYNKYIKRNCIKYSNKNLINFRRPQSLKNMEDKKKDGKQMACYKCDKYDQYKTSCLSLIK